VKAQTIKLHRKHKQMRASQQVYGIDPTLLKVVKHQKMVWRSENSWKQWCLINRASKKMGAADMQLPMSKSEFAWMEE